MAVDLFEKTKARVARENGGVSVDRAAAVRFALAFPNVYAVGMASLGYQLVYQMLNELPNASCERVFLPDDGDVEEHIRTHTEVFTCESLSPLSEFDVVAFSISFELDYLNVLRVLKLANLPVLSSERDDIDPIVIAGGPCPTFNPEPLADIVDAFVIGDAENILPDMVNALEAGEGKSREEKLAALALVPSVYVPSLHKIAVENLNSKTGSGSSQRVQRAVAGNLGKHPSASVLRTEDAQFGDICLVEVSRGCGRKCRFCLAGHITRPLRPREQMQNATDADARLGLVGAAVFDHSDAVGICEAIVEGGRGFTVSSVRLETVTPEIVRLLVKGGQRTLTIAPEAGSYRLRRVINKAATDEQIFAAVSAADEAGLSRVKLYFMIGLPTETNEDIASIIDLVINLCKAYPQIQFQVSASSFVPKPWTPFQWHPMERENVLKKRYAALRAGISSIKGAQFGGESPRLAAVQGCLARGDRSLGKMLVAALENGGDYSGAYREVGINPKEYLYRERTKDEILPWDVLDMRVDKHYLWREYERAMEGEVTAACDVGNCRACGACG